MKKLFIALVILIPSLLFSQGIGRNNLILSAGLNFPTGGPDFRENYKPSYNIDVQLEHTIGKKFVLGLDVNHGKFPTYGGNINFYEERKGISYTSLLAYTKLQDNSMKNTGFQLFVKGGAGVFLVKSDGYNLFGHSSGFSTAGLTLLAGTGMNYFFQRGDKLFVETGYRYNKGDGANYNSIYLNAGISFCLNY
jgi:hypothetical protein